MPKPSDAEIQALPPDLRRQYMQFLPTDESGDAYQRYLRLAEARKRAQDKAAEEALMLEKIRLGDEVPPIIQDVLDRSETMGSSDADMPDFSTFTPGFEKFITTEDTPLTVETARARPLTPETAVQDLQAESVKDATRYYLDQGFKSEAQLKKASIDAFVEKNGTLDEYLAKIRETNPTYPLGTAQMQYEQAYELSANPPGDRDWETHL